MLESDPDTVKEYKEINENLGNVLRLGKGLAGVEKLF